LLHEALTGAFVVVHTPKDSGSDWQGNALPCRR
jgi:hypothetical protein